jgi:hypothetical protein
MESGCDLTANAPWNTVLVFWGPLPQPKPTQVPCLHFVCDSALLWCYYRGLISDKTVYPKGAGLFPKSGEQGIRESNKGAEK